MDPRWKHPFTCMVSGATGSGKTYFVKTLLQYLSSMVTPVPEEVIWCYGVWQTSYRDVSHKVTFREGLPDILSTDNKPRLAIVDDLMNEADKSLTDLFTKWSHHKNISVIHIVQNLFGNNKQQRTLSLNSII
ncbi:AAA ATPase domain [Plakobranchus ocellatus]|uniref:AAA ATPase domain n=1 Tax=Plakobranchus ocellatus TaxID=259542 RepID=A0AAV4BU07_9GAST|nr:AAA ATPase domain [Plakobranchus ocellatus]